MDYLLPPINLKGTFKLKVPLTSIISEKVIYTVDGIKTITSLITDELDVETLIYINQGLTTQNYLDDLKNQIPIVTLKSEGNALFHIPATYFTKVPQIVGVTFINKAMILNLGYIPKDLDLTFLLTELNDYVKATTGITPTSTIEEITGDFIVSYTEANTFETTRQTVISLKETCKGLLLKANATIAEYKVKMAVLVKKFNL